MADAFNQAVFVDRHAGAVRGEHDTHDGPDFKSQQRILVGGRLCVERNTARRERDYFLIYQCVSGLSERLSGGALCRNTELILKADSKR